MSLNVDDWVAQGNDGASPRRPLKLPSDWQPLDVTSLRSMLPSAKHQPSKARTRLLRPKGKKKAPAMSAATKELVETQRAPTNTAQQERNRKAWERLQAQRAAELGAAQPTKGRKKRVKLPKTEAQLESDQQMAAALGLTPEQMAKIEAASEIDEVRRQEYLNAFAALDTDGGGTLDGQELIGVMAHLGEDMEPEDAQKLIDECDKDGDGDISFDEFIDLMTAKQRVAAIAAVMRESSSRSQSSSPRASGVPLPPLALQSRTVGRRNRAKNPQRARPSPRTLLGPQATASDLRRELARTNDQLTTLTSAIKGEVEWIQEHCDVTSIRAQMFCQRWGAEKLERVLMKVAMHKAQSCIRRWKEVVEWESCHEQAQKYLQWRGGNVVLKLLEDWRKRSMAVSWKTWADEIKAQRAVERNGAAHAIQPIIRGWLSRTRVLRIVLHRSATVIQRRYRGVRGRRTAEAARVLAIENDAADKIQRCFRGYKGRELAATIAEARMQLRAVRLLQRRVRGWIGKKVADALFLAARRNRSATMAQCAIRSHAARLVRKGKEHERLKARSAVKMQCAFRGREGRKAYGEEQKRRDGAMLLQRQWRGLQGRKSKQEKLDAIRDRMARRIQSCWRGHLSRQEYAGRLADVAHHEMQIRRGATGIQRIARGYQVRKANQLRKHCAVRMQSSVRGRRGRKAAVRERKRKEELMRSASEQQERHEASSTMQTCWRRYWARHTFEIQLAAKRALHLESGALALAFGVALRDIVGLPASRLRSSRSTHRRSSSSSSLSIVALARTPQGLPQRRCRPHFVGARGGRRCSRHGRRPARRHYSRHDTAGKRTATASSSCGRGVQCTRARIARRSAFSARGAATKGALGATSSGKLRRSARSRRSSATRRTARTTLRVVCKGATGARWRGGKDALRASSWASGVRRRRSARRSANSCSTRDGARRPRYKCRAATARAKRSGATPRPRRSTRSACRTQLRRRRRR